MKAEYFFLYDRSDRLNVSKIKRDVSEFMNIPLEVMESKSRKRELVTARQISMSLAKKFTKDSLASIGNEIGGKDHATVLHACKTINNLLDTKDPVVVHAMRYFHEKYIRIRDAEPLFLVPNEELCNINVLLAD